MTECLCDMDGSVDNTCDASNGKCTCVPGIVGDKCQSKISFCIKTRPQNFFAQRELGK